MRSTSQLIILSTLSFLLLLLGPFALHAQPSVEAGEIVFVQCRACHALDRNLVGPALKDITDKYDKEWLKKWIYNAPEFVASGDERAIEADKYSPTQMQLFTHLTDDDLESVIMYIEDASKPAPPEPGGGDGPVAAETSVFENPTIYWGLITLIGALIVVSLLLVVIAATLVTAVRAKEQKEPIQFGQIMNQAKLMLSNKFVITAITTFALVGGLGKFIMEARTVGLHQGYMPEQPIAFSHKIHAGEYKIDCEYCHSGVSKSKNAWVPSANVCMNCHKSIANRHNPEDRHASARGDGDVSPEIAKIYEAVGWDPVAFKYKEDYEQRAIEWVRIHNVPDHAYFNHAQHVVVGKQECQTCHGPVEKMEVVYQYSDLGMGWCINCHRNEKVKQIGGEDSKYTVEDMGGLDCVKCHY